MDARVRVRVATVITMMALVVVALGAAAPTALADQANPDCLVCHEATEQFGTTPVDKDAACSACHTPGLLGTHPYHQVGANCGAFCHPGWGETLYSAVPRYLTSAGSFASPTSQETSSGILHTIHSQPRWPEDMTLSSSACASCHSPAACDACHTDPLSATHEDHGSSTYPSYTRQVGYGIIGEDQTVNSVTTEDAQCGSAECHDVQGLEDGTPLFKEDFSHAAYPEYGYPEANTVVKTGTWRVQRSTSYTGGQMSYSNTNGSILSLTFTGNKIAFISDLDPYRGQGEVWIDGALAGTFDSYSPTTKYQSTLWMSEELTQGPHSVEVKALGTKQSSARGSWVNVDAFKVWTPLRESIAPDCDQSCHADKTADHSGSWTHEASQTVGTYPVGRFDCTDCHTLLIKDEHTRASSKTEPDSCGACHTAYADYTLDEFANNARSGWGSCTWAGDGTTTGCHQVADGDDPHNYGDTDHTASDAGTADCRSCHGSELDVIHDDTNAARAEHAALAANGYSTDCLTCHGPAVFPTTKDCTDAGCHVASGVVSMATHPAPPHNGTNNNAAVLRTGGQACSTCHILEITTEHGKASSATDPGGSAISCLDCHNASYFPTGWLDTPGTTNTCNACHDPAGAADAGLPHEGSEYGTKHDWNPPVGNESACGTGAGLYCHGGESGWLGDVELVDLLHDSSKPGAGDCTSCHDVNTAVPDEALCVECHGSHTATPAAHDASAGTIPANGECVGCHTAYANAHTAHAGGCVSCHEDATLTAAGTQYLTGNFDMACTGCHAPGVLGADYSPPDPDHATGTEATHTASPFTAAYQGAGGDGATPAGGKECSTCHSDKLKTAHASTSTNGGSVTCVECHTDTTIGGASEVAADWTNDKCKDCHDTGAATTHDAYVSAHTADDTRGCADSGAGCHGTETNLAALHDTSQSGGAVKYNSCSNSDTGEDCHVSNDTRPTKLWTGTDSCGSGSSGCHTEKTTTNHGADHGYTAASEYSDSAAADSESGCAASGTGCHDSAATGDAVTTFHPQGAIDCLTSECHVSPSMDAAWKAANSGAECAACHDGTFTNAADMIELYDASASGHYGETTHGPTAMGSTVSAGGTYSATCSTCHDNTDASGINGLYYQHTALAAAQVSNGDYVTLSCSECHNHSAAVTTEVTTKDWDGTCADCHNGTDLPGYVQHGSTAPAVTGTEAGGAGSCETGGCHSTLDLHELHKSNASGNPNGCTMSGCHDATKQGWKPTDTSCGSGGDCHTGTVHPGEPAAHTTLASDECVDCHESGDLKTVHADNCGTCHGNATYPTLPTGKLECTSCHTSGAVANARAGSGGNYTYHDPTHYVGSETTHTADGVEAGISNTGGKTCVTCHQLEMKPEHYKSSTDTSTMSAYDTTCVGCHELEVDSLGGWGGDCQECHATATVHVAADYTADHDWNPPVINEATCGGSYCHDGDSAWLGDYNAVDDLHAASRPGAGDCTSCHDTNTAVPTETVCTDCHGNHASSGTVHNASAGSIPANQECLDCHPTYASAHFVHSGGCVSCHENAALTAGGTQYLTGNFDMTCTGCHAPGVLGTDYSPPDPDHATGNESTHTASPFTRAYQGAGGDGTTDDGGKECNTCHSSTLKNAHASTSANGGSVTCVECHTDSTLNSSTEVAADWTNDKCKDCHDHGAATTHDAYDSAHLAEDNSRGCAESGSGCHGTSTNLATLHDSSQSGGSPDYNSCSNSDTGEDCHVSNDTRPTKVWTGTDSCGSGSGGCHTEMTTTNHGPDHDYTASSAYADGSGEGAETGCASSGAGCHASAASGDAVTTFHASSGCLAGACHTSATMDAAWKAANTGAECAACHDGTFAGAVDTIGLADLTTAGHYNNSLHTATGGLGNVSAGGTTNASCADCHELSLKDGHQGAAFSSTSMGSKVTCGECHTAATAEVKTNNWTNSRCDDCHDGGVAGNEHGTTAPTVTGSSSAGCGASGAGCHSTYNLHALHADASSCGISGCHDAVDKDMGSATKTCGQASGCHTSATYQATSHTGQTGDDTPMHEAVSMTTKVDGTTYDTGGSNTCEDCHTSTLETAHDTAGFSSPYCDECHNSTSPVDSVTTIKTNSWSAKTCDQCHVTNGPGKHSTYTAGTHTATDGANSCASCHGGDVRAVHNVAGAGCSVSGTDGQGWAGACHDLDKDMGAVAMTCGTGTGGCHTSHTDGNHGPEHDISNVIPLANQISGTPYVYHGTTYGSGNSWGCGGCHFTDLVKEHGTAGSGGAGRSMEDGGVGCGVCHTNKGGTVGSSASNSAVVAAITDGVPGTGDMRCVTCHNGLASGTTAPHVGAATSGGSTVKSSGNPIAEFADDGYKSGGHNIGGTNYAKINPDNNGASAGGVVNWPYAGTFVGTNPRTGVTWTRTDQMVCSDCHRFSASATTGPQGAAALYESWAGGTTYTTAKNYMNGVAPYVLNGASGSYGMCSGCHGTLSSTVHAQGQHNNPCVSCHVAIPHSSPRPRLLAGAADAAPYSSGSYCDIQSNAAVSKNNCNGQPCNKHGGSAPYW